MMGLPRGTKRTASRRASRHELAAKRSRRLCRVTGPETCHARLPDPRARRTGGAPGDARIYNVEPCDSAAWSRSPARTDPRSSAFLESLGLRPGSCASRVKERRQGVRRPLVLRVEAAATPRSAAPSRTRFYSERSRHRIARQEGSNGPMIMLLAAEGGYQQFHLGEYRVVMALLLRGHRRRGPRSSSSRARSRRGSRRSGHAEDDSKNRRRDPRGRDAYLRRQLVQDDRG